MCVLGREMTRLDLMTWPEVGQYLERCSGIFLPVGSTEQHGPMGLIGTDAICATAIAEGAARASGGLVAPTVAYTPAPFNTGFPGTVSITEATFRAVFSEVMQGLFAQGFRRVYVLNAHGANLEPMRAVLGQIDPAQGVARLRSWWDFAPVNALRTQLYGDWEGLHATPSEVSITQSLYHVVPEGEAAEPPRKLSVDEIEVRAGDRHGPPDLHRAEFPDGRVGAHSALARPEHGARLLAAAIAAVAEDYSRFKDVAEGR